MSVGLLLTVVGAGVIVVYSFIAWLIARQRPLYGAPGVPPELTRVRPPRAVSCLVVLGWLSLIVGVAMLLFG